MNQNIDRPLKMVARALVAIGGINWGLVGLFRFDLVATLFGAGSKAARAIYTAVGLATVYTVVRAVVGGGEDALGTVDPKAVEELSETPPFGPMDQEPQASPL